MLITNFFNELIHLTIKMAPYLVFGSLLAGILSVFISQDLIERNLGKKQGLVSIIKASLFGIPLPLCSCSVIPVAASLKKHGASKGAVTSFLLSTPQTGVDSIMLTYGLLGPIIAFIRPIIALITGLFGGVVVHMVDSQYTIDKSDSCHDECCGGKSKSVIYRIFKYSFITLPKDIAKPLIIGLIIASLISLLLSPTIFTDYVGNGLFSMFFMIIIGTPLYICATASIPIAVALISKGATVGAAMVFLMVGPATNTTSIITMIKILGKKSTIIILITLISLSIVFGLLIDYLGIMHTTISSNHNHIHAYTIFDYILSILFSVIILYAIIPNTKFLKG